MVLLDRGIAEAATKASVSVLEHIKDDVLTSTADNEK